MACLHGMSYTLGIPHPHPTPACTCLCVCLAQDRSHWEAEVRESAAREATVLRARLASLVDKVEQAEEEARQKVGAYGLHGLAHGSSDLPDASPWHHPPVYSAGIVSGWSSPRRSAGNVLLTIDRLLS
jgi:hypothetical protein